VNHILKYIKTTRHHFIS